MKFLFCNIAWLDYYKGIYKGVDMPAGGESRHTQDPLEKYNFEAVEIYGEPERYCLGYVSTKSSKTQNQLHIEKINGCESYADQDYVEDVTVVYCARHPAHNFTTVVGWYKHATVYRYYQEMEFPSDVPGDNNVYIQYYNAIARASDCVLLPRRERSLYSKWNVPRRTTGAAFGFGQSNVWFATENSDLLKKYLEKIEHQINGYDGENWLYKYPEI